MRTLLAALGSAGLFIACGAEGPPHREQGSDASPGAAYYEGTGTIVAIDEDHVRIEHDEIPGFMSAMTMSFELEDPSLAEGLEAGMDVKFRLEVADRSVSIVQIEPAQRTKR